MRFFTIFLFAMGVVLTARGAVVEGVVLDEETGNALARTQVSLIPLPGTPVSTTQVRTGARGSFVILSVRPGWYILRATRRGYIATESGQLRPGRPGHAFEVADDRSGGFLEIRMSHLPAITGTVFDENGIGIPRWPVHVYSSGKPIRHIAQTVTDDRGMFRVGELDPGVYLVRTGPGPLEDQTPVLATYLKNAVELKDALAVRLRLGEKLPDVAIYPVKGKLLSVSGTLLPVPDKPASLILVTDTGRREIASGAQPVNFNATGIQPGPIELIVKGFDSLGGECGSYIALTIDKDVANLRVACAPIRKSSIQVSGAQATGPPIFRRVDLDGAQEAHSLGKDEVLAPGHWEVTMPPGNYYTMSARNNFSRANGRSGEWFGFDTGADTRLAITLATASSISGTVSTRGSPVSGAPIFLTDTSTGQAWTARSDPQGNYRIAGLPPSSYSVISGFDLDSETASSTQKSDQVGTSEGNTTTHALELVLP